LAFRQTTSGGFMKAEVTAVSAGDDLQNRTDVSAELHPCFHKTAY